MTYGIVLRDIGVSGDETLFVVRLLKALQQGQVDGDLLRGRRGLWG